MTTRTRSHVYLSIATPILTAALAVPASAQTSCAGVAAECFKGTFQGEDRPCHSGAGRHYSDDQHNRHGNRHPSGSILIDT